MRHSNRFLRILPHFVFAVVLALVLAACTDDVVVEDTEAPDVTEAPDAMFEEDLLVIAFPELGTESMDPSQTVSSSKAYLHFLYDYLVGVSPDGFPSEEGGLAESWEIEHFPDSSRYTFNLRQGIEFHNGDPLTSKDVAFSLNHVMREESIATYVGTIRNAIDVIETPDDHTVVITTSAPYGLLHWDLSGVFGAEGMILPSSYIEEVGIDEFTQNPIGSGPYRFVSQSIGESIELEAVADNWRVTPRFANLLIRVIPEEGTRIAALQTGEVDVIDVRLGRSAELEDEFNIFNKPGSAVAALWIHNTWEGQLGDPRIREALNLAVNTSELLDTIYLGSGELVGASMAWGTWAIGYEEFGTYDYDPERAQELLAEAAPAGDVELTLISYSRAGSTEVPDVTLALADYWTAIGVNIEIVPMEFGTYLDLLSEEGSPELIDTVGMIVTSNRAVWAGVFRGNYHSEGARTLIMDPDVDALIAATESAVSEDELGQAQRDAVALMRERHYLGPLFEVDRLFAANPEKITTWDLGKSRDDINVDSLIG